MVSFTVRKKIIDFKMENNGSCLNFLGVRHIKVGDQIEGCLVVDFFESSSKLEYKNQHEASNQDASLTSESKLQLSEEPDYKNTPELNKIAGMVHLRMLEGILANSRPSTGHNIVLKLEKLGAHIVTFNNQIRLIKLLPVVLRKVEFPQESKQFILDFETLASISCSAEITEIQWQEVETEALQTGIQICRYRLFCIDKNRGVAAIDVARNQVRSQQVEKNFFKFEYQFSDFSSRSVIALNLDLPG